MHDQQIQTASDRFLVALTTGKGLSVVRQTSNDPVEAMRVFIDLCDEDFARVHGLGSNVSLTDNMLLYDAAKISDGIGTYIEKVAKEKGRRLLAQVRMERKFSMEAKRLDLEISAIASRRSV